MIRALILLALLALAPVVHSQPVFEFDSQISLRSDEPAFGGFSAIHVSGGGRDFLALSDRGHILQGRLIREDERLIGVDLLPVTAILDSQGVALEGRNTDAEGVAVASNGELFISFEGNHRIMRHSTIDAAGIFMPKHPDFRGLQVNSGMEGLAIDRDDTIYAIPERSGALDQPFPVYRYRNGAWDKRLQIDRQPPYLVVGADIFDGYLYVLERHLGGLSGFSNRIRRFPLDDFSAGAVLITTRYGRFDNLEGISLWQDATGATRATLVSDDNFKFYQRNQIVEFVLNE